MRDCAKISRKIFSQKSIKEYLGKEIRPGINIQSDDELDEVIKNTSETAYHPSCSNKMGIDNMSVVDPETKVYGISRLTRYRFFNITRYCQWQFERYYSYDSRKSIRYDSW